MQRQRTPGRRPGRDTDPDMAPPNSLRTPDGTQIGYDPTMRGPRQCKTMMLGLTIMPEGPMDGSAPAQAPDKSGQKVGESATGYYKRGEKLGEGGMGEVYKAVKVSLTGDGSVAMQMPVAIKVVKFDEVLKGLEGEVRESVRKEHYDRFLNEVQVIAKLRHPNIIQIIDFGEDFGEGPFYVMEFLEGKDLDGMINEQGPLGWERARPLMRQACKALDAAHNHDEEMEDPLTNEKRKVPHPIIHRDIKPGNIFVLTDRYGEQTVKVLDFGIAKIVPPSVNNPTHGGERVMGTPDYMAPEQAYGMTIDNRTDIYGMGAMMYHVLTGCTVFADESVAGLLAKLTQEQPVPLRERRPDLGIPEDAERIVMRCLEKDPAKRYQSMQELREDLIRSGGMETPGTDPDAWGGNSGPFQRMDSQEAQGRTPNEGEVFIALLKKRRRKRLAWGIGAAGLAAAAAVALTLIGGRLQVGPDALPIASSAQVAHDARAPMQEAIIKDAEAPRTAHLPMETEKRVIRLRTQLEGVEVFSGEKLMCSTREDGTCSMELRKGESLNLILKKEGYQDREVEIFKDTSGSLPVTLERRPARVPKKRPPPMRVKPVW